MEFTVPKIYTRMLESPHILIAGTTGSGKSVALNSLLYSAMLEAVESGKEAAFTYVDLKMIELVDWRDLPNCDKYVDRPEDVAKALKGAVDAMYARYKVMQSKHIKETEEGHVYIVVDELADLVKDKQVLEHLVTLGRLGRAAHYHLILCTQDPSRTTLSAALMQNMTCRVALRTKDPIESRQIVGRAGAERLPKHGKGLMDMDGQVEAITVPMVPQEDIQMLIQTFGPVAYTPKSETKTVSVNGWTFRPPMTTEEKLREQIAALKKEVEELKSAPKNAREERLEYQLAEARATIERLMDAQ